jgi:PAS domain S-box-containing protein
MFGQKSGGLEDRGIHRFYMDIINSVPDAVYWIDINCHLLGCNNNFVKLMGLNQVRDFNGTPYEQMKKFAHWTDPRIEALRLDDMKVIFSGQPHYSLDEKPVLAEDGNFLYFKATRVPMYDENKKINGLIVVLTDVSATKKLQEKQEEKGEPKVSREQGLKENHLPSVLMIEDNIIAQNVERALLTALNCRVDIAETGDKAIELFGPGKYDLVLMDIGLENTSGYVVAKQLRDMEKNTSHHVPIIALTGYAADVVKYDCGEYFMEGAITKPLTSEQAEQIIKHYVYHMDVPVSGLKSM